MTATRLRFDHVTAAQRIRFSTGRGRDELAAEVGDRGAHRILLIAGEAERSVAERLTHGLPVAATHDEIAPHVPVAVAQRARAVAQSCSADLLVSVGGGSTTGLAKAVALTTGLPIVAIPTTYAGSEATDVWGLTEAMTKTTGSNSSVRPQTVIYDAELTLGLPVAMSVASGLNALAHCVDSFWAPRSDPINMALAEAAARALHEGLPVVAREPSNLVGRETMLFGSYLAAVAFDSAGSGLHHKICHTLGGMFDLPHAETHAIVLPYVVAFNSPASPEAAGRIAAAFGGVDAVAAIALFEETLRGRTSLRDIGMAESGIADAATRISKIAPTSNPRPVTVPDMEQLLRRAWLGENPRSTS